MLNDLVRKVAQTQLPEKDQQAEDLLQRGLGGNPDSLYILAQTVLVQNIALDRARAQIQQMQQQAQASQPPAHSTSFLGSLLGRHEPAAGPPPPPSPVRPQQPPPQYYPPAPASPPDYSAAPPSGGSSFLRSAATTAAGVAAGALAFEGVESILHGFGHGGGGFGGGSFGGERPVEETVVNNYYDDPAQGERGGLEDRHEREASFDDRPEGGDRGVRLDNASYDPNSDLGNSNLGTDTDSGDLNSGDDLGDGGLDDSTSFDDPGSGLDDGGSDDTI